MFHTQHMILNWSVKPVILGILLCDLSPLTVSSLLYLPVKHHPGGGEGPAGGENENGDEKTGHRLLGLRRL